jgi:hypothetical protein
MDYGVWSLECGPYAYGIPRAACLIHMAPEHIAHSTYVQRRPACVCVYGYVCVCVCMRPEHICTALSVSVRHKLYDKITTGSTDSTCCVCVCVCCVCVLCVCCVCVCCVCVCVCCVCCVCVCCVCVCVYVCVCVCVCVCVYVCVCEVAEVEVMEASLLLSPPLPCSLPSPPSLLAISQNILRVLGIRG